MASNKQEHKNISLELGDTSMDARLGVYYIDMREARVHYDANLYGGGFDVNGVPLCLNGKNQPLYFPINILQYGFILHAEYTKEQSQAKLNSMLACLRQLEILKTENTETCAWYHLEEEEKYHIPPPWASGMAQGEAISFYLRLYQITNDQRLLESAKKAYAFLKVDFKDGGVRRRDAGGNLWFEEYPTQVPTFVLNGFIYTLFGLYDLYRVTKDPEVYKDIQECLKTLEVNLPRFDAGYWSYYDLRDRELVRYYYQKNVHVLQLDVLYELTDNDLFKRYADRWRKTLNPFNFIVVQLMYRIWPRWQKLNSLLSGR